MSMTEKPMREFKFRAWERGNMFYQLRFGEELTAWDEENGSWINLKGQPETKIMQYTGFRDEQGNLVYENDIIQEEDGFLWTVEFDCGTWTITGGEYNMTEHLYEFANKKDVSKIDVLVVGNIYENPHIF